MLSIRRSLGIATAAALLLSTAVAAGPMRHRHGGPGPGHAHMMHMLGALDLTADQRIEVESLVLQSAENGRERAEALRTARAALADQIHAPELDEAAIRQAVDELAKVELDQALARATLLQQVREVLTPEQRSKLDEVHQQWREQRHERGQRFQLRPGF